MAVYTFYMGQNVTGYLTEDGAYYTCNIVGYGAMYQSVDNFTVPAGQQVNVWNASRIHQDTIRIPEGITTIADKCFMGLGENYGQVNNSSGVKHVILPESLKRIGYYAFRALSNNPFPKIQTITFGHNIELVDRNAFEYQNSLVTLDLHDNAGMIVNGGAFNNCVNLEYVGLPDDWFGNDYTGPSFNTFMNCRKLSRISPNNVIHTIRGDMYRNCERLGRVYIKDRAFDYTPGSWSFYVDLFAGDNCDEDGYYITEVNDGSVIDPLVLQYDWKNNWHRIILWFTDTKVYLYHLGRIIEISCHEQGVMPVLKHDDIWYFLQWVQLNGTSSDLSQSPLHVAHNGHWYQISY